MTEIQRKDNSYYSVTYNGEGNRIEVIHHNGSGNIDVRIKTDKGAKGLTLRDSELDRLIDKLKEVQSVLKNNDDFVKHQQEIYPISDRIKEIKENAK